MNAQSQDTQRNQQQAVEMLATYKQQNYPGYLDRQTAMDLANHCYTNYGERAGKNTLGELVLVAS